MMINFTYGKLVLVKVVKWRCIKLGLMALLIQFAAMNAMAQTKVSGVVKDSKGEALPGVSVRVKNTNTGATATNKDGRFTISAPTANTVLVFSLIGFKSTEMTAAGSKDLDVTLIEDVSNLNEVIVIGYGTTTKKDVTGAVGIVNVADLQKSPVRSFEEALAGRVAGVQVVSQSGQPGSPINILIRGIGSITQSSAPLFVIDGFPIENPDNNLIDPDNIESITVLKDASATAIYGARGSNGVIVVTTKRGKKGPSKITYAASYGQNRMVKELQMLSPYEFVKLQGEELGASSPYYANGLILEDYRNAQGTDWQAKIMQNGGQQNHSLSISGGGDKTLLSITGNYLSQDGMLINSGYDRYQGRMTLDHTYNDRTKIGGMVTYTANKMYGRNTTAATASAIFYNAFSYRPIQPPGDYTFESDLYDPEFENSTNDLRINPVSSLENEIRQTLGTNFIGNLYVEYNILKNLKLRLSGNLNSTLNRVQSFDGSDTRKGGPNSTSGLGVSGAVTDTKTDIYETSNTLNYNVLINKVHSITALAGVDFQTIKLAAFGISGSNLPDEELGFSALDDGIFQPSPADLSQSSLASGFVRGDYNYKSKYYITGTFRADGSSKFRKDNRWSYFPSGAVKWKISEEPFFKKISFISDANIRASYGVTGNNRVSDYASYALLTFTNPLTQNGQLLPNSAVVSNLANTDLKWEKATSTDVGLDIGFLKNKLNLSAEYYKKSISNLLFNASLPSTTGYTSAIENIGDISNTGFEFTLDANIFETPKFSWDANFNITFNRNKLLALSNPNEVATTSSVSWEALFGSQPAYIAKVGSPLGQIYGMIFDGLYQYSDFDKLPNGTYVLKGNVPTNGLLANRAQVQPGAPRYKDLNNDGQITDQDRTVIGNGYPKHIGGLNNSFRYKNFDLNVFLQWSVGTDIINANRMWFDSGLGIAQRGAGQNASASFANRWTPDNQNTDIAKLGTASSFYSTQFTEDGSYLRLKTLNIGYTLPDKVLKKAHISRFRVYVATSNIYTFTGYKGYDPEVSAYQSGLTPGLDWSAYPRPLNITVGLNLTL